MISTIAALCRAEFDFDKSIFAATLAEWDDLIARNPFAKAAASMPTTVHAALLESAPRAEIISLMRMDALEADGGEFRVWQPGFHPKAITRDAMMLQKLEYVHQNPVRKGFVRAAEDWRYSSAGEYLSDQRGELEIDRLRPLIV